MMSKKTVENRPGALLLGGVGPRGTAVGSGSPPRSSSCDFGSHSQKPFAGVSSKAPASGNDTADDNLDASKDASSCGKLVQPTCLGKSSSESINLTVTGQSEVAEMRFECTTSTVGCEIHEMPRGASNGCRSTASEASDTSTDGDVSSKNVEDDAVATDVKTTLEARTSRPELSTVNSTTNAILRLTRRVETWQSGRLTAVTVDRKSQRPRHTARRRVFIAESHGYVVKVIGYSCGPGTALAPRDSSLVREDGDAQKNRDGNKSDPSESDRSAVGRCEQIDVRGKCRSPAVTYETNRNGGNDTNSSRNASGEAVDRIAAAEDSGQCPTEVTSRDNELTLTTFQTTVRRVETWESGKVTAVTVHPTNCQRSCHHTARRRIFIAHSHGYAVKVIQTAVALRDSPERNSSTNVTVGEACNNSNEDVSDITAVVKDSRNDGGEGDGRRLESGEALERKDVAETSQYIPKVVSRDVELTSTSKVNYSREAKSKAPMEMKSHLVKVKKYLAIANESDNSSNKIATDDTIVEKTMIKYWLMRNHLFTKFSRGIVLDEESFYSVCPEALGKHIAKLCQCDSIIDPFCGAGGNIIQFTFTCKKVIGQDFDPNKIHLAKRNAQVYGVQERIVFQTGDYFHHATKGLRTDVVFMSPPWGGPEYLNRPVYSLADMCIGHGGGDQIVKIAKEIAPRVAIHLPRNVDKNECVALAGKYEFRKVQFEHNFIDRKLNSVTLLLS